MPADAGGAETPKPVIFVVTAAITDWTAYKAYIQALVASGLLARFGATGLATGPVAEPLEGAFGPDDIAAVMEFPSADAAKAFWNSPEYREIARLREQAGAFRVGLWRKLPPRAPAPQA
jgi:uncharacterized protein (DUF1330 family)